MDILISVAGRVAEYTVAPIGRKVGYLILYKANCEELTVMVKELEGATDNIKHFVEAEIRNGNEIEAVVYNWLDRVYEVIEEANQLLEDHRHAEVGCSRWSIPNLTLRYQLSRKAKKMAQDVIEVQVEGKFERVSHRPVLDEVAFASPIRGGKENLESRKSITEDIMQALRDSKVGKIGVFGLAGVGKTILVKEIAKKAKYDKLFDAVVMAIVSQNPDLRRIQGQIADHLGLNFVEETDYGRARRLHERIKKEKTVLIVLDDIWETLDLNEVGIPFGDEHSGCKVLMTSRNKDVLRQMEAQMNFRLEVLSQEETWSLFKAMAGDVDKEPSLHQIASEVAKKCAGLPVLIVTVARALKNREIEAWEDALNKLEGTDSRELPEIAYSALELSYNQLEGTEMKALFLLCAAIGEMFTINDLFKYGIGLGIFERVNTLEDARNRLHKMISALKASCLLLEDDTSVELLKMHDVVRDVAISIASRDNHVFTIKEDIKLKEWPPEDTLTRCTQIILNGCYIQELPERLDCSELKLLYLNTANNHSLKIPDSFFHGMVSLQVLDLKCMNMSSLPTSLASLIELKILCLDKCSLEDMAGVGALKNLEILSLVKSSIRKLPSEIGKLIHLRMLDLEGSRIEIIPPNIISNLIKLEELYMGNTTIKWEVENLSNQNQNASLAELNHLHNLATLDIRILEAWMLPGDLMFEKLERYRIVVGDVWEWTDIMYGISRTLMLNLKTIIHSDGIKELIKRVEDLYLDEIDGISNILYQLDGEGFPLLKYLHIQNNKNIQHIINSVEWTHQARDSFPNLELLELHNLTYLDKIYHGPLDGSCFSNLRIIKVKKCDRLENLFLFSMVKGLSRLLEIEVAECDSLKEIVGAGALHNVDDDVIVKEDEVEFQQLRSLTLQLLPALRDFYSDGLTSSEAQQIPFFGSKVAFPKLETLKLRSLKVKYIWEVYPRFPTSIKNLSSLNVEDCGHLKYLFSSFIVEYLSNLKELEISQCHAMEEIIMATAERINNTEFAFPKLETLKLRSLNLKKIWEEDQHFPNLSSLIVEDCGHLKYLFSSIIAENLSNLKRLEISRCHAMERIIETIEEGKNNTEVAFPKLETLTLRSVNFKIWEEDQYFPTIVKNLTSLIVEDFGHPNLFSSFNIVESFSNLKRLEISQCHAMEGIIKATEEGQNNAQDSLLKLETLKLSSLHLKKIWGKDQLSATSLIYLTSLTVENCDALKYLFSSSMIGSLKRLEQLEISKCHMMEAILRATEDGTKSAEVLFPNLERVIISDMENLKTIWQCHQQPAPNSLGRLKRMEVKNCEKLLTIFSVKNS